MTTEERMCRFSILVKRPRTPHIYTEEELAAMSRVGQAYLDSQWLAGAERTHGDAYVQLADSRGQSRTFYYHTTQDNPGRIGIVSELEGEHREYYDDRIDYSITQEQYGTILASLLDPKSKKYNVVFNNCATFAVDTAKDAGIKAPTRFFMVTPGRLERYIRHQYEKEQAKFSAADATIGVAFSEMTRPSTLMGTTVPLLTRLQTELSKVSGTQFGERLDVIERLLKNSRSTSEGTPAPPPPEPDITAPGSISSKPHTPKFRVSSWRRGN